MEVIQLSHIRQDLFRKRIYAFTADLFFVSIINKLVMATYMNLLGSTIYHYPLHVQEGFVLNLTAVHTSTLLAIFTLYFFGSYFFGEGQTPGKLIFQIKVVGRGEKLTFWESLGRTVGYFTCYALGLVLFSVPFFRKDRKGIPDFFSKTIVKVVNAEGPQEQTELFDKAA